VNLKPAGLALYPILIPLLALPAVLLILGVVLPAVWSTRPTRRHAAQAVLTQLLTPASADGSPHRPHVPRSCDQPQPWLPRPHPRDEATPPDASASDEARLRGDEAPGG
jgi:hypothetical protein